MRALKLPSQCRYDEVSLGEVMLRLDPGDGRVHTTRSFSVCEGGGEYNVARGLRRCFGLRTGIVTALADNPIGRLVEDLMLQGGVDLSYLRWVDYDGVGRQVRNGLNFTERGFGPRGGVGCSDRGHTAISQLRPEDVDWVGLFRDQGVRWLHTGGVFCGLSDSTPLVARAAMTEARAQGTCVSYDLNYRASLWRTLGGKSGARAANRSLLSFVDVLFGDLSAAIDPEAAGIDTSAPLSAAIIRKEIAALVAEFPNLTTVATTLRTEQSASAGGWGALCWHDGQFYELPSRSVEILDRVGGGDGFAAGFIYGLLAGKGPHAALEYGLAHGALAMSTPGDNSMATLAEVEQAIKSASARIER